jgi:16S rRNA (cytosine967-C5)-methyltransferase
VSRYYSYLNSAAQILQQYEGDEPFTSFLKKYFAANKKHGSKDRKQIAHLCYCYFRLGNPAITLSVEERILMGLFLCTTEPNKILQHLKPVWIEKVDLSIEVKCLLLQGSFPPLRDGGLTLNVFPWKDELSEGIEHEKFCESFFIQPDLFIRIRPLHAETVLLKLGKAGAEYEFISPFTVRLPNSFKANQYFDIDKEVVVQDYNSQQIAHLLPVDHGKPVRVWDCCAASGGKSIMAYDINSCIELTVSDVRESILVNLKKRFEEAGIDKYRSFISDLAKESSQALPFGNGEGFDLIICDAPCSGSGTWSRTPEQLYYFEKSRIDGFASLQKKIVSNTIPHLKPGGYFLYITCSVFKKENEEAVEFIKKYFDLHLIKMEVLKGYDKKADTMFAALVKKAV